VQTSICPFVPQGPAADASSGSTPKGATPACSVATWQPTARKWLSTSAHGTATASWRTTPGARSPARSTRWAGGCVRRLPQGLSFYPYFILSINHVILVFCYILVRLLKCRITTNVAAVICVWEKSVVNVRYHNTHVISIFTREKQTGRCPAQSCEKRYPLCAFGRTPCFWNQWFCLFLPATRTMNFY